MKSTDRFILWCWVVVLLFQVVVGLFSHLTVAWLVIDEMAVVVMVLVTLAFKIVELRKSKS